MSASTERIRIQVANDCRLSADKLVRAGKISEAIAEYEAALRLDPQDPLTRNNLGRAISLAQSVVAEREVDLRLPLADLATNAMREWLGRLPARGLAAVDSSGYAEERVLPGTLLDSYRRAMKLRSSAATDEARLRLFSRATKVAAATGTPRDFLVRAASAFFEAAKIAYWSLDHLRSRQLLLAFYRALGLLLEAGSEIPPAHRAASGHGLNFLSGSHFPLRDVRQALSAGLLNPRWRPVLAESLGVALSDCPELVVGDQRIAGLPRDLRALLVAHAASPRCVVNVPFGDASRLTELLSDDDELHELFDRFARESLMSREADRGEEWRAAHLRAAATLAADAVIARFPDAQRVMRTSTVNRRSATPGTVVAGHPACAAAVRLLDESADPLLRARALVDLVFVFTVAVVSTLPMEDIGTIPQKNLAFGDWLTFLERGASKRPDVRNWNDLSAAVRTAVRLRNELAHSASFPKGSAIRLVTENEAQLLRAVTEWQQLLPGVLWDVGGQSWVTVASSNTNRANAELLVATTVPELRCWYIDRAGDSGGTYQAVDLPRSEGSLKIAAERLPHNATT